MRWDRAGKAWDALWDQEVVGSNPSAPKFELGAARTTRANAAPGCYLSPESGALHELGAVQPAADGSWQAPTLPNLHDWVLALRRA
jgi:hypothetical protein